MRIALSTNWNAARHETGEPLVDEILGMRFDALELGYHMTEELAVGVRRKVESGAVVVDSSSSARASSFVQPSCTSRPSVIQNAPNSTTPWPWNWIPRMTRSVVRWSDCDDPWASSRS